MSRSGTSSSLPAMPTKANKAYRGHNGAPPSDVVCWFTTHRPASRMRSTTRFSARMVAGSVCYRWRSSEGAARAVEVLRKHQARWRDAYRKVGHLSRKGERMVNKGFSIG
jgi:hypothetical protein